MTSLDHIRTFAAVAETGSLSGAARALQLTQPTVGRHIDLLEASLNVSLFTRGRDGMTLTAKGADLVEAAEGMLQEATGFERQAAGMEDQVQGTLRVAVNEVLGVLVLPKLLPDFMDANPDVEVELVIDNAASNLLQRDADIAIRMFRPTQSDLVARKVGEIQLGFYAHQRVLEQAPPPRSLSELKQARVIGFDRDRSMILATEMMGEAFARRDFAVRTDNILAHIEAIRAGLGFGVTHDWLARSWPEVEKVLPDLPIPPLEVWLTCHADVRHNKRVRLMMEFLAENLPKVWAA